MSQWARVPHFSLGTAAIRYAYNAGRGLYEWVQTGPLLPTAPQSCFMEGPGRQFTETSLLRHRDSWIILCRSGERLSKQVLGVAWFRTDDLFGPWTEPIYPGSPLSKSPCSAFRCPDGVVRVFTNDSSISPYQDDRNPLYSWEVDPDHGFKTSDVRVVFDAQTQGMMIRPESWPRVDMPNLFPHPGGREQILSCRARVRRRKFPYTRIIEQEKAVSANYHCRVVYDRDYPATWQFAPAAELQSATADPGARTS
jgi:hypothetical protein